MVKRTLVPVFVVVGFSVWQVPSAQEAPTRTLIANVTVIDGTGAAPVSGVDIWIEQNRILRIVPTGLEARGEGTEVIDAAGHFVMPGLFDAHVHVSGPSRERAVTLLEYALQGGVTSVRDMAGDARQLAGLRHSGMMNEIQIPTIYYAAVMAGPAFLSDPRAQSATQGYEPGQAPYMQRVTDGTNVGLAVATARGTGASGIKIYAAVSDGLVARIVAEARSQGILVWAHGAVFPAKPLAMVRAGVTGLSHAPYLIWEAEAPTPDFTLRAAGNYDGIAPDDANVTAVLEAMTERGTVMDPTLFLWRAAEEESELGRERAEWAYAVTSRARELGVILAAGTDALGEPDSGDPPNIHAELELLVERAGLTPLEAVTAATINAARVVGVVDEVGSIEAGKVADLLILSADPSVDIVNTRSIVHVMKGGRIVRQKARVRN